ncbi:MAG: MGMT family protein [Saprospiraceae bacterium]|nr:MGMT family protein [Saprospiraceae bacterium]
MSKNQGKLYYEWVYAVVKEIPRGRVTTYGAIADYLALGSARMVGYALRQSFTGMDLPAFRVVNHAGHLSGRHQFRPPSRMQELLEAEGTEVANNRVLDFRNKLWIPAEEMPEADIDI